MSDTTAAAPAEEEESGPTYDFDEDFQLTLVALLLRDPEFNSEVEGLIDPSYMTNHIDGILTRLALDYYNKYRFCPTSKLMPTLIKEGLDSRLIRKDDIPDLKERLVEAWHEDLTGATYVVSRVEEFAKRQALEQAIFRAAELIDTGKYEQVEGVIKEAMMVGVNEDANRYDYWETIDSRAHYREELLAGRIKPDGVTTGHKDIDKLLYHNGWGRKELSLIMGPAKSGKSMSLIGFGLAASMAGFNVAYVSLEVSSRIVADRSDANVANIEMSDLTTAIGLIKSRVSAKRGAAFDIFDFPTGTLSPLDLRRLVARRAAAGVKYDLIIVDYADLMRPDAVSNEPRENSRLIYVGLRAIAHEFNAAMLSATQTNREGFKAAVGKMENVAEDINKARTVDLLLSLNATDDEKLRGEARIYFAASRNQKSDLTIRVKTEIGKAKYISQILGIE